MHPLQSDAQADDSIFQLELDLIEILRAKTGVHEQSATQLARAIVDGLRERYGGMKLGSRGLYIPAPDKRARDDAIRREFNGGNAQEIMRKHGIGRSRLYQIVQPRIGVSSPAAPKSCYPAESPLSSHAIGQPYE